MTPRNTIGSRIIVKMDKIFDDTIKHGTLELQLVNLIKERKIENLYENKRTFGEVVAVPERLGNEEAWRSYYGHPKAFAYNPGYNPTREYINPTLKKAKIAGYRPSLFVPETQPYSKWEIDIARGDKVYFMYSEGMYSDAYEKTDAYYATIPYQRCICVVRGGKIIPVGGWTLCKPVYSDDVVDLDGIKSKVSDSGLVTEINVKPEALLGRVVHYGKKFFNDDNIGEGDKIIYRPNADREVEIEGESFIAIRQEEMIAWVDDMRIVPVRDWMLIRPQYEDKVGLIHVVNPVVNEGFVLEGPLRHEQVRFESASSQVTKYSKDLWFIREGDVYWTL